MVERTQIVLFRFIMALTCPGKASLLSGLLRRLRSTGSCYFSHSVFLRRLHFSLLEPLRHSPLVTEAAMACIKYAQEKKLCNRLYSFTAVPNIASENVMKRPVGHSPRTQYQSFSFDICCIHITKYVIFREFSVPNRFSALPKQRICCR